MNAIELEYKEIFEELELETHFHNQHEIIFITEGAVEIEINGKAYRADANCIIFISNLESHHIKVLDFPYKRHLILLNQDFFDITVNEPTLLSIFKYRPVHFSHLVSLDSKSGSEILNIVMSLTEEVNYRKAFWDTSVKHYLNLFFIKLYRYNSGSFPSVNSDKTAETFFNIQKYIDEHYVENISLKNISKLFYSDIYYISRTFKKIIGFSFKEYLILKRLSKAKDMLFNSNDSISGICMQCGFTNVNNFIRTFKKYEGITPYQYRKTFAK